ncbi:MAG: transposase [Pseudonocardiaceae bacterium]
MRQSTCSERAVTPRSGKEPGAWPGESRRIPVRATGRAHQRRPRPRPGRQAPRQARHRLGRDPVPARPPGHPDHPHDPADSSPKWTTETAYAVTSLTAEQATAVELATWVRGHWRIENRLHWVRGVTLDEDRSQIRTGNGPRIMASVRMLRLNGATNIAQALRHHAWDPSRPIQLLLAC